MPGGRVRYWPRHWATLMFSMSGASCASTISTLPPASRGARATTPRSWRKPPMWSAFMSIRPPRPSTPIRRTSAGSRNTQRPFPFHPDPVVVAQSGRNLVFDPAGPVTERRLLRRGRAIAGAHRCFHRSMQRDSRAIRLSRRCAFITCLEHVAVIPVCITENSDSTYW